MGIGNNNTHKMRRVALIVGLCGGIGGMLVDADHILSAITKGQIPWAFLHQHITIVILIGCVIASLGGLLLSLVLRSK